MCDILDNEQCTALTLYSIRYGGGGGKKAGGGGKAAKQATKAAAGKKGGKRDKKPAAAPAVAPAFIDYFGKGKRIGDAGGENYYVTTAINYTNGPPHMGHAYEAVTSDVLARYNRAYGRNTFFLTGTDEHGQKIADSAKKVGRTPQQHCDVYAENFQKLNVRLHISNDFYVRTTQEQHAVTVEKMFRKCLAAGDIYLGTYKGWYNIKEELFVTEKDAEAAGYKDAAGNPLVERNEPSYFFRMSKYHQRLVDHIKTSNAGFVQPESRRKELLARLDGPKGDGTRRGTRSSCWT